MSFSCSAQINGALLADGSAKMSFNMSIGQRMTNLIRTLSGVSDQTYILNGEEMAKSVSGAPGVKTISLKNSGLSGIEGNIEISKINDFLSATGAASGAGSGANSGTRRFITFEQDNRGGKCVISINKNNSAHVLSLLSEDIENYLNALMAPCITGDDMTKTEYLELISLFYNKPISDEIASSRIRVQIDFPGTITSVTGGTYSGRRAVFDIALIDFLVLEKPINLEVQWR